MELMCRLVKKTFVNDKGEPVEYFNLEFQLDEENTVDVKIKSDKAKLLLLSEQLKEYR